MYKYNLIRFIIVCFSAFLITACNDNKLLDNLTQQQANQVLAILQQHNISAQKTGTLKGGYSITVGKTETTSALSVINQYQLPWQADVQIQQAFPDSSLVASPQAEHAKVISLQEQRLEQSLRIIGEVVNAKVHISYPSFEKNGNGKSYTAHVGVLITYKGDVEENIFISQIKSFIKNSIENVRYENISVVLFHAPTIQHAPPMPAAAKDTNAWIMPLIAFIGMITIGGYFLFTKRNARTSVTGNKDSNETI
ncbi:type III secretion inner membrane ring lipoprotein SctJ [Pantoea sp. LMR881]|uniref:type III secretion system inner membrane ring lipoprotein SctJ n=1 Tax=Pantoea sp. LMR881 TaxID=3014336 RepID=UPI0022AEBB7F|nr:type III secretion inner membrane ring lipoprotein SctJ [Pantoea sp. LMR881]MCZ4057953.1 type III secretion inner membrane ring lipoprotein SctJ [Pantoea sp. LMR881]